MKSQRIHIPAAFIRFRFRQAGKFVKEMPLPYLVLLLGILAAAGMAGYSFMEGRTGGAVVGAGTLLLLLPIHLKRKDFHFIQLAVASPWMVFCVDYWLLSCPVMALETVRGHWAVALALLLGCAGVSLIRQPYGRRAKGFPVPRLIPAEAFEIRTGLRRDGWVLLVFYAGAFVGLLLPYLSFAMLWVYTVALSGCFRDGEPVAVLCSRERPAGRFIGRKLGVNLRLFALSVAPVCLLYTAIRPGDWWLALFFFVMAILNVALFILMKYALYRPGAKITGGQVSLFLSMAGMLLPFLAPVTLFLLVRYAVMAKQHLTPHLYVYN
ncbi:MAG: hypothetical protein LBQ78_04225 [Tannerellaceae bacterium]|nr:hypothetical protein [Tannerellaceae bacterium]